MSQYTQLFDDFFSYSYENVRFMIVKCVFLNICIVWYHVARMKQKVQTVKTFRINKSQIFQTVSFKSFCLFSIFSKNDVEYQSIENCDRLQMHSFNCPNKSKKIYLLKMFLNFEKNLDIHLWNHYNLKLSIFHLLQLIVFRASHNYVISKLFPKKKIGYTRNKSSSAVPKNMYKVNNF